MIHSYNRHLRILERLAKSGSPADALPDPVEIAPTIIELINNASLFCLSVEQVEDAVAGVKNNAYLNDGWVDSQIGEPGLTYSTPYRCVSFFDQDDELKQIKAFGTAYLNKLVPGYEHLVLSIIYKINLEDGALWQPIGMHLFHADESGKDREAFKLDEIKRLQSIDKNGKLKEASDDTIASAIAISSYI